MIATVGARADSVANTVGKTVDAGKTDATAKGDGAGATTRLAVESRVIMYLFVVGRFSVRGR